MASRSSEGKTTVYSQETDMDVNPEGICTRCRLEHRNRHCFKQHRELKKKLRKKKSQERAVNGLIRLDTSVSDNDFDDSNSRNYNLCTVARTNSIKFKKRLLYGIGALHHFVRNKSDIVILKKLFQSFEFDQVVGDYKLTHQCACRLKFGKLTQDLKKTLYSPEFSCNIVSAIQLK